MVDSQDMQRSALKTLIQHAVEAEKEFLKAPEEGYERSCTHLELLQAMERVRGAAYVRYGALSSPLYCWAIRYFGVPHHFECHKQDAVKKGKES